MFKLLDTVRLRHARTDLGLPAGALGAVVLVHDERAYEVEFADEAGRTLTIAALRADELEPPQKRRAPARTVAPPEKRRARH